MEKRWSLLKKSSSFNINMSNLILNRKGNITTHYDIKETLGKGGFGEVKKVIHKLTWDVRAMKIVKLDNIDKGALELIRNEIEILKKLDHPHIVKLYEVYEDE